MFLARKMVSLALASVDPQECRRLESAAPSQGGTPVLPPRANCALPAFVGEPGPLLGVDPWDDNRPHAPLHGGMNPEIPPGELQLASVPLTGGDPVSHQSCHSPLHPSDAPEVWYHCTIPESGDGVPTQLLLSSGGHGSPVGCCGSLTASLGGGFPETASLENPETGAWRGTSPQSHHRALWTVLRQDIPGQIQPPKSRLRPPGSWRWQGPTVV